MKKPTKIHLGHGSVGFNFNTKNLSESSELRIFNLPHRGIVGIKLSDKNKEYMKTNKESPDVLISFNSISDIDGLITLLKDAKTAIQVRNETIQAA